MTLFETGRANAVAKPGLFWLHQDFLDQPISYCKFNYITATGAGFGGLEGLGLFTDSNPPVTLVEPRIDLLYSPFCKCTKRSL